MFIENYYLFILYRYNTAINTYPPTQHNLDTHCREDSPDNRPTPTRLYTMICGQLSLHYHKFTNHTLNTSKVFSKTTFLCKDLFRLVDGWLNVFYGLILLEMSCYGRTLS